MTPTAPAYTVTRNEDHTYIITCPEHPGGRMVPGVTTILKARANNAIAAWKVADLCERLGVKKSGGTVGWKKPLYVGGLWEAGKPYSADQIAVAVNTARAGAFKKSEKAKETGTDAHAWIEACISCDAMKSEYPAMPTDPEAACSAAAWLSWREAHQVEWFAAESFVGSRECWYGGTYDARCMVNGPCTEGRDLRCIVDWKTSSGIYEDIWLQLSALLYAHREMTGDMEAYQRIGARVPKDGKALEWVEAPAWASHDLCMDAFTGLIHTYHFNQAADAARGY